MIHHSTHLLMMCYAAAILIQTSEMHVSVIGHPVSPNDRSGLLPKPR